MGKCLVILLIVAIGAYTHTHSHSHEPPHAKYGREVNEKAAKDGHAHDHHGHSHGAGGCPHAHGHSHEDHGHSHDDHGHSHEDHGHSHESHGHSHDNRKPRSVGVDEHQFEGYLSFLNDKATRIWWYSIGATLLISAFPCFILLLIPISGNTGESSSLLKVLLAFGSGGLLGDAFLHLIPHATPAGSGHSHSHSHSHEHGHSHEPHDMFVGGCVLAGIIAFLVVEKLVRILRGEHGHGHSHNHGQSHGHKKDKYSDDESKGKDEKKKNKKDDCDAPVVKEGIKIAAILNLIADFAHNFTDGLAIGASFSAGPAVGWVTTATVLVHEIPHEIGDFAILIQSGYSKYKAMGMQLITAIGALSGCLLSLWATNAGDLAEAAGASAVLPFTAGGFIYIATVSVIPELLEKSSTWQSIKEIFALLLGIYLMYLIALYE